jgi:A/G-specific adenine glycosylase
VKVIDRDLARDVATRLLGWYDESARDLPWRRTRDPYRILLSEVMLQQTRASTVIPYYQRFVRRFPDARSLAAAPEGEVLAAWAGLGYYRRARSLRAAARAIVDLHGGALPASAAELRALPGVGAYTAGAVASIAFGERVAAVDGNVTRVLARLLGVEVPAASGPGARLIREAAGALVPAGRSGDFNQALMELGATVCAAAAPRCAACPISTGCAARRAGNPARLPVTEKKPAGRTVRLCAVLATRGARAVLGKRPAEGLYAGMWEPPMLALPRARASEAFARAGLVPGERLGRFRHVLTHRVLDVTVLAARARGRLSPVAPYERIGWRPLDGSSALSTLARKVLAHGSVAVR